MTTIRCAHCGQTYDLTPEQAPQYAGQTITCTACQRPFTVELPGAVGVAPPPLSSPTYASPYPQQKTYSPQQLPGPQQTNGLAVASLICGIVSFCIPILGSIAAIVLGILGLGKTKDPRVGGKGMAITGIVLGGVSVLVTPCFISILLPSLNRARETANRVKCASNLKQIGLALAQYASDHGGRLPDTLGEILLHEDVTSEVLICPTSDDEKAQGATAQEQFERLRHGRHCSYVYHGRELTLPLPDDVPIACDSLINHDGDGMNLLFADGHVEFLFAASAESAMRRLSTTRPVPRPPATGGAAGGI